MILKVGQASIHIDEGSFFLGAQFAANYLKATEKIENPGSLRCLLGGHSFETD